jgi:hypothetical protein
MNFTRTIATTLLGLGTTALGCNMVAPGASDPSKHVEDPHTSASDAVQTSKSNGKRGSAYAPSAESRAWFAECSKHYDEFMAQWKPIDDEAQAAIQASKDQPFAVAAAKLTSQITKTCVDAKKLDWSLRNADIHGTGISLRIALAKAQAKDHMGVVSLFGSDVTDLVQNPPMTGDDFVDRNEFCLNVQKSNMALPPKGQNKYFEALSGQPRNSVHWLTTEELDKFNARRTAILDEQRAVMNELSKQFVPTGGETGRIKSVTKNADGSLSASLGRVESPYECRHTGTYRWDGVAFNDCTYVDLAPREIYGFSAHFTKLPPTGLKAGDTVFFQGTVNGKPPSNVETTNAKWEVLHVSSVFRGSKPAYQVSEVRSCM